MNNHGNGIPIKMGIPWQFHENPMGIGTIIKQIMGMGMGMGKDLDGNANMTSDSM